MKLNFLFLVTIVLAITAFGFTGSEVKSDVDATSIIHSGPQGVARCGLTVDVTVTVSSGSLVISAAGDAGNRCSWSGMDVYFTMRYKDTGHWINFPAQSGTWDTYTSGTISTSAFDRFQVTVDAFDEPKSFCTSCSSNHQMIDDHQASTFVAGDL